MHSLSGNTEQPGDFPGGAASDDGTDGEESQLLLDQGRKRTSVKNSHRHISPAALSGGSLVMRTPGWEVPIPSGFSNARPRGHDIFMESPSHAECPGVLETTKWSERDASGK